MKTLTGTLTGVVLLCLLSAGVSAETVKLTAELDRPVLSADEKQTVYLRVGLKGIPAEHSAEQAPVNVAIIIDKSGSMGGKKIEKAKESAILALHRLRSSDIVSVVLYDSQVEVLVPATKLSNREAIIRKIRSIEANGSTALYAGVQSGAEEVRKFLSKNQVNRIVLLSDGLANVGPDSPSELGRLGANLSDEGIAVTTIGLGLGYNEDLMTQLAYRSDGGHYFAEDADELAAIFDDEFGKALSVVAQQVQIEIICGEGIRPVRILGREGEIKDQSAHLDIQTIHSEHEKYVILEVEVPPHAKQKTRELASVRVNYRELKTNTDHKAGQVCQIRFTDSKEEVEQNLNQHVMADAVEQIAIENNQRALALRDQGDVQGAQQMLRFNSSYLYENSEQLKSSKLAEYASENIKDADNLDENNWNRQRKSMRESQSTRQTQR